MTQEEVQAVDQEQAGVPPPEPTEPEKPKKPKGPKMVNVANTHRFREFCWGAGNKIMPGCTGKVPLAIFEKVSGRCNWIKRAERGDVV